MDKLLHVHVHVQCTVEPQCNGHSVRQPPSSSSK